MAQIEMPNILGQFLQGKQAGQQEKRQRTLGDFLQPALGGDQAALAKVYSVDPDAGLQVQGMGQKQQTADRETMLADLQQSARLYSSATPEIKQHLYGKIVDLTEKVGIAPSGSLPRQHDPALDEGFNKFLAGIAGPVEDNTPSSIRELQMLQSNPELAALDMKRRTAGFDRPQLVNTEGGYAAANLRSGEVTPLTYSGGGAPDQSKIQNALAMLAGGQGVQMTSGLRTPERNAAVGGKPNSQHLRGTAGDYVVPQDQKAAFIANAQAQGLQAIDEGDHIHVQQPRGGRVMPAAKSSAPSDFERRISMAQSMGATPDQLKQMVIGETGGGKPSATQIKLANTAKAKLIDLKAMEDQLGKVEAAFAPLKGSVSAGPLGNYLPTVEGKQFDAAVSLLKGMARKLTRTPGEGAMSDYESRLAELANPSRGEYEDVTGDQIQQLRALVKTTREGYEALLQDAGGSTDNLPGNGGAPKAGTIEAGYRFKGGDPSNPSSWEKV